MEMGSELNKKKKNPCIECKRPVKGTEEAITCDHCGQWEHMTCIPGRMRPTKKEYKLAVKGEFNLKWICMPCICKADSIVWPIAKQRRWNAEQEELNRRRCQEVAVAAPQPARPTSARTKKIPIRFRSMEPKQPVSVSTKRQKEQTVTTRKRQKTGLKTSKPSRPSRKLSPSQCDESQSTLSILQELEEESNGKTPSSPRSDAQLEVNVSAHLDVESEKTPSSPRSDAQLEVNVSAHLDVESESLSVRREAVQPSRQNPQIPPLSIPQLPPPHSDIADLAAESQILSMDNTDLQDFSHLDDETPIMESTRSSTQPEDSRLIPTPPPVSRSPIPPLSPNHSYVSAPVSPPANVSHDPLDDLSYEIPQFAEESSMMDPVVTEDLDGPFHLAFKVLQNATSRGKDKLVDTRGYGYILRKTNKSSKNWRCDVYNPQVRCTAAVVQREDQFTPTGSHCHAPKVGKAKILEVVRDIKERAASDLFASAQTIVTDSIKDNIATNEAVPALQREATLRRTANRVREKTRPADPRTLDFDLDLDFIPEGFLQEDIQLPNGRRHILFGSTDQLKILAQAKRWYVDGTFQIVRRPFYQLLTVHCFVKKDDIAKQVPLCYVVMSGKEGNDYKAVFRALRDALPTAPQVKEVMLDFELAIWKAVKVVFPMAKCVGCCFHWKNAVWRKIQEIGLQRSYLEKGDAHQFMQQVMALPFIPHERIAAMLTRLRGRAGTDRLKEVCDYVQRVWIDGEWKPESWCTFMQSVRTNNDVEGWHNRLNRRAQGNSLAFYRLMLELYNESQTVNLQMELLCGDKLAVYQKKKSKQMQGRIFKFWSRFNEENWTTERLLRACAKQYGNAPVIH